MKKLLLFSICTFPLLSLGQECNDFKTGRYTTENSKTIIIRTENRQEEIIESLGLHVSYDIAWINNCHYALYNRKQVKGSLSYIGSNSDTIFIEITNIMTNEYEFQASSNYTNITTSGKIIKLND